MIRREGSGYEVLSQGGKNMGREPTHDDAERRLRQVEYFKHLGGDEGTLSDQHSKQRIANLEGQLQGHRAALAGQAAGQGAYNASRLAGSGGQSRAPAPERQYVAGVDFPSAAQIRGAAGYDPYGQSYPGEGERAATAQRAADLDYQGSGNTPLDDSFRQPGQYSYQYKDPTTAGAAPGTHVGPMAQELESIPGVVSTGADGLKRVNAPRLSLATASQTAKHRRELDELHQKVQDLSDEGDDEGVLRAAAGQ